MNRKLFFWLERLRITPQERITVSILLVLLLLLTLLNILVEQSPAYGPSHYRAVEAEFRKRSALKAERQAQILARYNPLQGEDDINANNGTEADLAVAGPTWGADTQSDTTTIQTVMTATGRININTADFGQLQTLPGIGPFYARRIIEYRSRQGSFRTIEELKEISGIGEKRLEALRPYVTI